MVSTACDFHRWLTNTTPSKSRGGNCDNLNGVGLVSRSHHAYRHRALGVLVLWEEPRGTSNDGTEKIVFKPDKRSTKYSARLV